MPTIVLNNLAVEYRLLKTLRNKRLSVSVRESGLSVSVPKFVSTKVVETFLLNHADWILLNLGIFEERKKRNGQLYTHKDFLLNKSKALKLVRELLSDLNSFYGFKIGKVSIKNQRGRWGSCSIRGDLNFNYKLVYLDREVARYVVAHELSHLKEMNHGQRFWKLVALTVPDYKQKRQQLKSFK